VADKDVEKLESSYRGQGVGNSVVIVEKFGMSSKCYRVRYDPLFPS
jgi:hypothetical protein